jgi:hypothetical protein
MLHAIWPKRKFLSCIRELPGSNLGRAAVILTADFRGSPQSLEANFEVVPYNVSGIISYASFSFQLFTFIPT